MNKQQNQLNKPLLCCLEKNIKMAVVLVLFLICACVNAIVLYHKVFVLFGILYI